MEYFSLLGSTSDGTVGGLVSAMGEFEMRADQENVVTAAQVSNTYESVGCESLRGSFAV